jgi:hypothetical protein
MIAMVTNMRTTTFAVTHFLVVWGSVCLKQLVGHMLKSRNFLSFIVGYVVLWCCGVSAVAEQDKLGSILEAEAHVSYTLPLFEINPRDANSSVFEYRLQKFLSAMVQKGEWVMKTGVERAENLLLVSRHREDLWSGMRVLVVCPYISDGSSFSIDNIDISGALCLDLALSWQSLMPIQLTVTFAFVPYTATSPADMEQLIPKGEIVQGQPSLVAILVNMTLNRTQMQFPSLELPSNTKLRVSVLKHDVFQFANTTLESTVNASETLPVFTLSCTLSLITCTSLLCYRCLTFSLISGVRFRNKPRK